MRSRRRRSVRVRGHDYAGGLYFVTACTWGRQRLFGRVIEGEMCPSEAGQIARDEWRRTGEVRPAVVLDAFVVMPDHVHLLFGIVADDQVTAIPPVGATRRVARVDLEDDDDLEPGAASDLKDDGDTSPTPRATHRVAPTQDGGTLGAGSVGATVGQYKSVVTKRARVLDPTVRVWQRGFHDRVVRTDLEADALRRYVGENLARWDPGAPRADGHRA